MSEHNGLWIAIGGGSLADKIESSIQTRWEFSYAVPQADVKPRRAELVVVSLRGTIPDYIGISVRGRPGTTGQTTVMISNLIPLKRLKVTDVKALLPGRFKETYTPPSSGIYRPTPRLWSELQRILIDTSSEITDRIAGLQRALIAANSVVARRTEGGLEIFERDAVASALQAWQGPTARRRVLRSAIVTEDPRAPFLARLQNVPTREDPQINHDHTVFPGLTVPSRDIVSAVTLSEGSERITILNCNRQPLEETLGVDLIYYSHHFHSFTLVQYKRMVDENGSVGYRPTSDLNHAKEINRMRAAEAVLQSLPVSAESDTSSYRLTARPFFIKLCETKATIELDSGLVSGMYVPLELWEALLKSEAVIGPQGGIRITWENCVRRLRNAEFTNLLRYGWIGSALQQTEKLSEIIETVLSSGRMLILAATQPGTGSMDYRRDNWGRFATEDDPEGAF
jgi:hypothetical protein